MFGFVWLGVNSSVKFRVTFFSYRSLLLLLFQDLIENQLIESCCFKGVSTYRKLSGSTYRKLLCQRCMMDGIVAVGKPEQQVRKASHYGSKQQ